MIDLKSEAGRDLVLDLVREVDVVVENFRPQVMGRLGLDYETLAAINPRLVYVSINGFGADNRGFMVFTLSKWNERTRSQDEIVGEINDEYDVEEPEFAATPEGDVLIDGGAAISEVSSTLGGAAFRMVGRPSARAAFSTRL